MWPETWSMLSRNKKLEATRAGPAREAKIRKARALRGLARTHATGGGQETDVGGPVAYVKGKPLSLDLDYKPYQIKPEHCYSPEHNIAGACGYTQSEASTDIGSDSDSGPDCDLYCSNMFNINAAFIRRPRMPKPSSSPVSFGPDNFVSTANTNIFNANQVPHHVPQFHIGSDDDDPIIQDVNPDTLLPGRTIVVEEVDPSTLLPGTTARNARRMQPPKPAVQQRVHRQRDHDPYRYSHYSMGFASVVKQVKLSEATKVPEAMEALDKEWKKLIDNAFTFDDPHEMRDIKREADRLGYVVHFARLFQIIGVKHSEATDKSEWKCKGRVIIQGNNIKTQNHDAAVFDDLS